MTVIDEIAAERKRQINVEGWTPEHDDCHADGSMAKAAGVYALCAGFKAVGAPVYRFWPWADEWFKEGGGWRRMLIKAAALIVAEIERIDREAFGPGRPIAPHRSGGGERVGGAKAKPRAQMSISTAKRLAGIGSDISEVHELKTHPVPFQAAWAGIKRHEIRINDRNFEAGDILHLREFNPTDETYSGRELKARVTYMSLGGTWGLPQGLNVMSFVESARKDGSANSEEDDG